MYSQHHSAAAEQTDMKPRFIMDSYRLLFGHWSGLFIVIQGEHARRDVVLLCCLIMWSSKTAVLHV